MQIKLAQQIRDLRKKAVLTQEQLAEALGVSPSAVHKWEAGKSVPELEMLVDIARFFEVSVDALLDYGWERLTAGKAAEKLREYRTSRRLEEGLGFAEAVVQKFPNSFPVVYQSAQLYFVSMVHHRGQHTQRTMELLQRCLALMDQNTDPEVGPTTIHNNIAACYAYLGQMDRAIEILQENNVGALNDGKIGLLMSQDPKRVQESLPILSGALYRCYAQLYEICIGFFNAYGTLEQLTPIEELAHWLLELGKGLKIPGQASALDKTDVRLYTVLAEVQLLRGNEDCARTLLKQARHLAMSFDSAPHEPLGQGLKFYHIAQSATSYDDMGETAMATIENYIFDETTGKNLRPLWEEICQDE